MYNVRVHASVRINETVLHTIHCYIRVCSVIHYYIRACSESNLVWCLRKLVW